MAKTSTAKRWQETQLEPKVEGSGFYNETSENCGTYQGTAGLDGQKKKILNPSAEAEKHQENPSGGWGSLWRKREELRKFLLSFLKPGIHATTCWSFLTWPLGLNSEKWNTFIQYHVSDHSGWCGLWINQVASLGNFWNHNKYFGFAYSGRLWRSLYFPGCRDEAWGFPGGSDGKESACNAGDPGSSLGWEDPLEKGKATHSSILAWEIPQTEELESHTEHAHVQYYWPIWQIRNLGSERLND